MNQLISTAREFVFASIYRGLGGGFPKRLNREFEMPNREFSGTDQGGLDLKQGSGGLDKSEKPLLGLPVHWQFASGDSFERKFCRLRPREDGLLDSG